MARPKQMARHQRTSQRRCHRCHRRTPLFDPLIVLSVSYAQARWKRSDRWGVVGLLPRLPLMTSPRRWWVELVGQSVLHVDDHAEALPDHLRSHPASPLRSAARASARTRHCPRGCAPRRPCPTAPATRTVAAAPPHLTVPWIPLTAVGRCRRGTAGSRAAVPVPVAADVAAPGLRSLVPLGPGRGFARTRPPRTQPRPG